jgi:hypothetical protein
VVFWIEKSVSQFSSPSLLSITHRPPISHPLIPSLNSPGAWSFWSEDERTYSVDHTRYFLLHLAHTRAQQDRGERPRISIKHAGRFSDYLSLQKPRVHRWPESGNMTFVLENAAGSVLSIYLESIYQSTRRNWIMSPAAQHSS